MQEPRNIETPTLSTEYEPSVPRSTFDAVVNARFLDRLAWWHVGNNDIDGIPQEPSWFAKYCDINTAETTKENNARSN